ncbi:unnamed protein product [Nesidiocoris tenuis]|uniref:Uncharacterized protein n=1 Tax=Nesidiocoris tenuis TaxID=355587 RepID=A0A6H5GZT0_9HEMI|nr:unnamed protein product [Nesidiocoris tenuis]
MKLSPAPLVSALVLICSWTSGLPTVDPGPHRHRLDRHHDRSRRNDDVGNSQRLSDARQWTFRLGMVNVAASFVEEPDVQFKIRTIVVNENYRTTSSNILLPEANNLGQLVITDKIKFHKNKK